MEFALLAAAVALSALIFGKGEAGISMPVLDPCAGYNFEQAALDASAAGAIQGAAVGPKGAAAGATLALASTVMQGCGKERFTKELAAARNRVCSKANKILGTLNAKPKGWDKWSCDQRLAFVAGAGPLLMQAVLAGNVAASAAKATANEVNRFSKSASDLAESAGKAAERAADDVGDTVKSGLSKVGVKL